MRSPTTKTTKSPGAQTALGLLLVGETTCYWVPPRQTAFVSNFPNAPRGAVRKRQQEGENGTPGPPSTLGNGVVFGRRRHGPGPCIIRTRSSLLIERRLSRHAKDPSQQVIPSAAKRGRDTSEATDEINLFEDQQRRPSGQYIPQSAFALDPVRFVDSLFPPVVGRSE